MLSTLLTPASRPSWISLAFAAALAGGMPPLKAQTTHTWTGPNSGDWAEAANWSTGIVPDAPDTTAVIDSAPSAGAPITISLPAAPVTIGALDASVFSAVPSITVDAPSGGALRLQTGAGRPSVTVSSVPLFLNTPLLGDHGFVKNGAGTLSFADNPHAQTYTGPVVLNGGRVILGSDQNLGDADNDLQVAALTTLIASPADSTRPLVLGAGRGIGHVGANATLALTNANEQGVLEIAGPVSGSGPIRFDGSGTLVLGGANTWTGTLTYMLWPGQGAANRSLSSALRFSGAQAVGPAGHALSMDFGSMTVSNSSIHANVDLGGLPRALNLGFLPANTKITNSTVVCEITNGGLTSNLGSGSLNLSGVGAGVSTELRLPSSATISAADLQLGTSASSNASFVNFARLRVGDAASLNLQSLRIGENNAGGRLDSLASGALLRLRGPGGSLPMNGLFIGNFTGPLSGGPAREAVLDLSGGSLDADISSIYIGGGAPAYPATAALRFGAGTLKADNLTLGAGGVTAPKDLDYRVEQLGGDAIISTLRINGGNSTGNVSYRYVLRGGSLAPRTVTLGSGAAGTPNPMIDWSGGVIRNYPSNSSTFATTTNPATPLEIVLSGSASKSFDVESGRMLALYNGCKLVGAGPEVTVSKTGAGRLTFNCQSAGFAGTIRLSGGEIYFDYSGANPRVAGSFVWDAGILTTIPTGNSDNSFRFDLSRNLAKTASPATGRILNLPSSTFFGTQILFTYASTDLTLADFTATGIASGYAADFTVGLNALSVKVAHETAFTTWRKAKLASSTNLGDANDLADPDDDGRPNLLEYALGSEPLSTDSAAPASVAADLAADRLTFTFHRVADSALTYAVLAADDPSGPWSGPGTDIVFSSTGSANLAGPVTVSDSVPLSSHPRRFLRLVVSR